MNHTIQRLVFCLGLLSIANRVLAGDIEPGSVAQLAGDYYFGDGLGVNCQLQIKATGTFAFTWTGCLGTYDQNAGKAALSGGILLLAPEKPNVQKGFRGTATALYPVKWGGRSYLVPTNGMIEFCSAVNQGMEPSREAHGQLYLRDGDWKLKVEGLPNVPPLWTKYLLKKPVEGKIQQLVGDRDAWINAGSADGILEGMRLIARDYRGLMFSEVAAVEVQENRCRIKCQWSDSKLAVGQKVTSRFHD